MHVSCKEDRGWGDTELLSLAQGEYAVGQGGEGGGGSCGGPSCCVGTGVLITPPTEDWCDTDPSGLVQGQDCQEESPPLALGCGNDSAGVEGGHIEAARCMDTDLVVLPHCPSYSSGTAAGSSTDSAPGTGPGCPAAPVLPPHLCHVNLA